MSEKKTAKKTKREKKPLTAAARAGRSAGGKKAMAARWGEHGETVTVRAYKPDAEKLKAMAPTTAEAIHGLLGGPAPSVH